MNIFGDMLHSSRNDGNSRLIGDSMNGITPIFAVSPPK